MKMISHKTIYFPLLLLFLVTNSFASGNEVMQKQPPNIIFIMADDLGYRELGSYGNTFNETPNLDKLAAKSKVLPYAYTAAAVCSPTRASIMTGKYPARIGITDFIPEQEKTKKYLQPDKYLTVNEALKKKGYYTGIVGKWHLDTQFDNPQGSPKQHGFDEVIGSETEYIANGDYFYPYTMVQSYPKGKQNEYLTDRQNEEACRFITRNQDKSFFLYLSYYSVHTRLEAPDSTVAKYKKKYDTIHGKGKSDIFENNNLKEANTLDNPYLAAMLEHIDKGVGDIMATLEKLGLAENTIVIFTSDNGGANHVANNGELKANKTWLYEGGIRVPFMIHWPNKIAPGVDNTPISSIDYYPTFVAAAGADPQEYDVDGINLLPMLTDLKQLSRNTLYWHYPCETAHWTERMASSVRHGDYKLIKFYLDDRYELYNLKNDPSEQGNLIHKEPQKLAELAHMLEQWKKEVNAEEPNAEAINRVRNQPQQQATKRTAELKNELNLNVNQTKEIHVILSNYFTKNEEIRKFYMKSEQRKIARDKNNKDRTEKIKKTLNVKQLEKYISITKA